MIVKLHKDHDLFLTIINRRYIQMYAKYLYKSGPVDYRYSMIVRKQQQQTEYDPDHQFKIHILQMNTFGLLNRIFGDKIMLDALKSKDLIGTMDYFQRSMRTISRLQYQSDNGKGISDSIRHSFDLPRHKRWIIGITKMLVKGWLRNSRQTEMISQSQFKDMVIVSQFIGVFKIYNEGKEHFTNIQYEYHQKLLQLNILGLTFFQKEQYLNILSKVMIKNDNIVQQIKYLYEEVLLMKHKKYSHPHKYLGLLLQVSIESCYVDREFLLSKMPVLTTLLQDFFSQYIDPRNYLQVNRVCFALLVAGVYDQNILNSILQRVEKLSRMQKQLGPLKGGNTYGIYSYLSQNQQIFDQTNQKQFQTIQQDPKMIEFISQMKTIKIGYQKNKKQKTNHHTLLEFQLRYVLDKYKDQKIEYEASVEDIFMVDAYIPDAKLVVETVGPVHVYKQFGNDIQDCQQFYDYQLQIKVEYLKNKGYNVVVLDEYTQMNDDQLYQEIRKCLEIKK